MRVKIREIEYSVDPSLNPNYWEFINSGKWEKETFDVLDFFIHKNAIVLDIGAWEGPITLYVANKASKVYSFEPDPILFPQLKQNVCSNISIKEKVKTFQTAISNQTVVQKLYARKKYGASSSSLLNRSRDFNATETCKTITLKDFIFKEAISAIDFIKLDVEGGEFIILPIIKDDLAAMNYPTLYISFHSSALLEAICKEKVKNSFSRKIILKLNSIFKLNLFQTALNKSLKESLLALKNYKFVYTSSGEQIIFEELMDSPKVIKNNSFVFTMKSWNMK